jgi:hypothetical protein
MRRRLCLQLGLLALPSVAHAGQCAGVSMADHLEIDGTQLQLNGMGLREATLLNIDIYVAGLYLQQRSRDAKQIILAEKLKHVRLVFVRDVSQKDMAENLGGYFRRAAGQDYDKLKERFERMSSWLPQLRKGDSFSVTYRPDRGLEVKHGNRSLGTIAGADFARVIFSIWLGASPPNPGLKTGMLGGACG